MSDREKVIKGLEDTAGYFRYLQSVGFFGDQPVFKEHECHCNDALTLLKEQDATKLKMWNALYEEEDKFEKKYAGTKENDNWFLIYRPWLQRGFEIAVETIAKQEGW